MCVTTQTDLYLGVAHGWDILARWPLDASTWMLGIIPYSVFLSYTVRWVASLGRIADSHLQNFSSSVSVPGCCVCRRLFVLFVRVMSLVCVVKDGFNGGLKYLCLWGFSIKTRLRSSFLPLVLGVFLLQAVIERTTLDRRQALRPKFSVWPVGVSSCFKRIPELILYCLSTKLFILCMHGYTLWVSA